MPSLKGGVTYLLRKASVCLFLLLDSCHNFIFLTPDTLPPLPVGHDTTETAQQSFAKYPEQWRIVYLEQQIGFNALLYSRNVTYLKVCTLKLTDGLMNSFAAGVKLKRRPYMTNYQRLTATTLGQNCLCKINCYFSSNEMSTRSLHLKYHD